jgi:hypothetical protein
MGAGRVSQPDQMALPLGDGITVMVAVGSRAAAKARLSRAELWRSIADVAAAAAAKSSPFDDWLQLAVEHSPGAKIDRDSLFVNWWMFTQVLGGRTIDRLPYSVFCKAMRTAGIAFEGDSDGRVMAIGVKLRPIDLTMHNAMMEALVALDRFLADCAYIEGPEAQGWTRARALNAAYADWATLNGGPRLSAKGLANALAGRSIAKRSSNGVLYQVALRAPAPPRGA